MKEKIPVPQKEDKEYTIKISQGEVPDPKVVQQAETVKRVELSQEDFKKQVDKLMGVNPGEPIKEERVSTTSEGIKVTDKRSHLGDIEPGVNAMPEELSQKVKDYFQKEEQPTANAEQESVKIAVSDKRFHGGEIESGLDKTPEELNASVDAHLEKTETVQAPSVADPQEDFIFETEQPATNVAEPIIDKQPEAQKIEVKTEDPEVLAIDKTEKLEQPNETESLRLRMEDSFSQLKESYKSLQLRLREKRKYTGLLNVFKVSKHATAIEDEYNLALLDFQNKKEQFKEAFVGYTKRAMEDRVAELSKAPVTAEKLDEHIKNLQAVYTDKIITVRTGGVWEQMFVENKVGSNGEIQKQTVEKLNETTEQVSAWEAYQQYLQKLNEERFVGLSEKGRELMAEWWKKEKLSSTAKEKAKIWGWGVCCAATPVGGPLILALYHAGKKGYEKYKQLKESKKVEEQETNNLNFAERVAKGDFSAFDMAEAASGLGKKFQESIPGLTPLQQELLGVVSSEGKPEKSTNETEAAVKTHETQPETASEIGDSSPEIANADESVKVEWGTENLGSTEINENASVQMRKGMNLIEEVKKIKNDETTAIKLIVDFAKATILELKKLGFNEVEAKNYVVTYWNKEQWDGTQSLKIIEEEGEKKLLIDNFINQRRVNFLRNESEVKLEGYLTEKLNAQKIHQGPTVSQVPASERLQ